MRKILKSKSGQGLLEMVFSIGILFVPEQSMWIETGSATPIA